MNEPPLFVRGDDSSPSLEHFDCNLFIGNDFGLGYGCKINGTVFYDIAEQDCVEAGGSSFGGSYSGG